MDPSTICPGILENTGKTPEVDMAALSACCVALTVPQPQKHHSVHNWSK